MKNKKERVRLSELMGIRFDLDTYQQIEKVARAKGIGTCDFVRCAIKRELTELGITNNPEIAMAWDIDKRDSYNEGHTDGYKKGYKHGYLKAKRGEKGKWKAKIE